MAAYRYAIAVLACLLWPCIVGAAEATDDAAGGTVPRFASMRSDRVNLRTGPGERYPIEWVLLRKNMPVEIIGEFEHWRRIRDWQGTEGWVQERMVTGRREVIVTGAIRDLHREPAADTAVVARAEPGVIGRLIACQHAWCNIEAGGVTGWVQRSDIFGVLPDETVP